MVTDVTKVAYFKLVDLRTGMNGKHESGAQILLS